LSQTVREGAPVAEMDVAGARQILAEVSGLSAVEQEAIAILLAESKGVGTCHLGDEPEPLFLEIGKGGLRYCCGHDPRHCSVISKDVTVDRSAS
jgi:hypothetical protein